MLITSHNTHTQRSLLHTQARACEMHACFTQHTASIDESEVRCKKLQYSIIILAILDDQTRLTRHAIKVLPVISL